MKFGLSICRAFSLAVITFLILAHNAPFADAATSEPRSFEEWERTVRAAEERWGEQWSVLIEDLLTGELIYRYNPERRLMPASNRKLIIFGMALETLGPDFTFKTQLGLDRPLQPVNGVFTGNMILRSNGDPTFDAKYMPGITNPVDQLDEWIKLLATQKVSTIQGDVIIDATAFGRDQNQYPEVWPVRHRNQNYAPIPSAISISQNLISFIVQPGSDSGDRGSVTVFPSRYIANIENRTLTRTSGPFGVSVDYLEDNRTAKLAGRIRRRGTQQVAVLPMSQPLDMIADVVKGLLAERDIELNGRIRILTSPDQVLGNPMPIMQVLGTHESPPLNDLLTRMMLESDNFLAEQIWRASAVRAIGTGTSGTAREAEQDWYRSMDLSWIEPGFDGCGLSSLDLNSPREFVLILRRLYEGAHRGTLLDSLPLAGRTGTLKRRFFSRSGERVLAKTGTLADAAALSGFVCDENKNPRFVFSIIANAPGDTYGRLSMRTNQIMSIAIRKIDQAGEIDYDNVSIDNLPLKRGETGKKTKLPNYARDSLRIVNP